MRIARFAAGGDPQYGVVELTGDGGRYPETVGVDRRSHCDVGAADGERRNLDGVRLLAPVIPRSKVVAVGRNYAAHAAEMGEEVPKTPLTFFKPNTSVIGPGEPIIYPAASRRVDFEGELAVVIGRICKEVPVSRVPEVIFGYTVANDVTARDLQKTDGQWARAKGYDTFCPLGPWITTHQRLDEVAALAIRTTVDGEPRQDGTTSDMIFTIPELVAYISSYTTLLPGDVILTGTPAGVGPCCRDSRSVSRSRASAPSPTPSRARGRKKHRLRRSSDNRRHQGPNDLAVLGDLAPHEVRVRFPPSPTGNLHVGNVRSALFNWVFARHYGGTFVLRVEDTDAGRNLEESYQGLYDSLTWLGLTWDEGPLVGGPYGPYIQTERGDIYRDVVTKLLAAKLAYRCYCTREEIEAREAARPVGARPVTTGSAATSASSGSPSWKRCRRHQWFGCGCLMQTSPSTTWFAGRCASRPPMCPTTSSCAATANRSTRWSTRWTIR